MPTEAFLQRPIGKRNATRAEWKSAGSPKLLHEMRRRDM